MKTKLIRERIGWELSLMFEHPNVFLSIEMLKKYKMLFIIFEVPLECHGTTIVLI